MLDLQNGIQVQQLHNGHVAFRQKEHLFVQLHCQKLLIQMQPQKQVIFQMDGLS